MMVSNGVRHYIESNNSEKIMKPEPNYFWNTEFLKSINEGKCYYCDEALTLKGRILKTCRCGFYLLGSPETLSFSRVISETASLPTDHDINRCSDCESTDFIYDEIRAETVCIKCGLVKDGPPSYSSYKKISYDSFKG